MSAVPSAPGGAGRLYSVTLYGYDPYTYVAATASKARYRAFRAWSDATGLNNFRWFAANSRVLAMGAVHGPARRSALPTSPSESPEP